MIHSNIRQQFLASQDHHENDIASAHSIYQAEGCNFENFSPTLVYLIIVQDGKNMQDEKFPKINKCTEWNKAMQVGIFQNISL